MDSRIAGKSRVPSVGTKHREPNRAFGSCPKVPARVAEARETRALPFASPPLCRTPSRTALCSAWNGQRVQQLGMAGPLIQPPPPPAAEETARCLTELPRPRVIARECADIRRDNGSMSIRGDATSDVCTPCVSIRSRRGRGPRCSPGDLQKFAATETRPGGGSLLNMITAAIIVDRAESARGKRSVYEDDRYGRGVERNCLGIPMRRLLIGFLVSSRWGLSLCTCRGLCEIQEMFGLVG